MDRIEMLPDNWPSLEDEGLAPIELEAKAHWIRFCPNLVASLNRQGPTALAEAVRKAWWEKEYLTLVTMAQNPQLHRIQAEELHRDVLWLPPEPSSAQVVQPSKAQLEAVARRVSEAMVDALTRLNASPPDVPPLPAEEDAAIEAEIAEIIAKLREHLAQGRMGISQDEFLERLAKEARPLPPTVKEALARSARRALEGQPRDED